MGKGSFDSCWASIYKNLAYYQGTLSILDMILFFVRIGLGINMTGSSTTATTSSSDQNHIQTGIAVDVIGSVILCMIGICASILSCCRSTAQCCGTQNKNSWGYCCYQMVDCCARPIYESRTIKRIILLNCNCPCYMTRPYLRFRIRFIVLFVFFAFRVAALALYAVSGSSAIALTALCAAGVGTLLCIFLFDLFQYCVWQHYTPATDNRWWCSSRSRKHQRYVPYILRGDFREANKLGDPPCNKNPCTNNSLEHIVMFHTSKFKPQRRWAVLCKGAHASDKSGKSTPDPLYIGFHATTPEAAKEIVHSDFRESTEGMLGAGVYFARSLESTDGKANHGGAWFVAQIRMGKVLELNERLPKDSNSNWHEEYDTCYFKHPDENKDEFVIKNPASQIIKWVVLVDQPFDPKVQAYGLDTEYQNTGCGCC